jgi:phospholipase/carboxylesterase
MRERPELKGRTERMRVAVKTRIKVVFLCLALLSCNRGGSRSESPPAPAVSSKPLVAISNPTEGKAAGLHYIEVIKGNAKASDRLPMVVMIHGMGDVPHAAWFDSFRLPARFILPQAPHRYGYGYSWFTYVTTEGDLDEMAFEMRKVEIDLAQAVVELAHSRPTIGKPIVCGFSQGGMLAYALALQHPTLFSAVFPVSGFLPDLLWPTVRPSNTEAFPPIVSMHGTNDPIVSVDPDKRLIAYLRKLGYRAELQEFKGVGHVMTEQMLDIMLDNIEKAIQRMDQKHE